MADMTPMQAVDRLRKRDEYLAGKIAELQAQNKPTYWFELDRESIAVAVSALQYLHDVQAYEAAQQAGS